MARMCDNCSRNYNQANSRSHSNIATKRRQLVNLQARRVDGVDLRLCTRCLRTMKKETTKALGPIA